MYFVEDSLSYLYCNNGEGCAKDVGVAYKYKICPGSCNVEVSQTEAQLVLVSWCPLKSACKIVWYLARATIIVIFEWHTIFVW